MRQPTVTVTLLVLGMEATLHSSEQAAPVSFEVVSIRPGNPDDTRARVAIAPGGRFSASNANVKMLIRQAFDIRENQIAGGPAWLSSDLWDVEAKATEGLAIPLDAAGGAVFRGMLQSLLADRFALRFHWQPKDESIYQLMVARGGAKLQPAEAREGSTQGIRSGPRSLTGFSASMSMLASRLSQQLGRPVVDKTGMTGLYDFTLQFSTEPGAVSSDTPAETDATLPSIFTALQESLGLRLESAKAEIQILTIDSARRPSDN